MPIGGSANWNPSLVREKWSIVLRLQSAQEVNQLIDAEVGLPQNGAQGPPIELSVLGDNELRERAVATQDDVTAVLALLLEAGFGERLHAFATRDTR